MSSGRRPSDKGPSDKRRDNRLLNNRLPGHRSVDSRPGQNLPVEFSRIIAVDRIGDQGLDLDLVAETAERAALAQRLDLLELPRLTARVVLTPVPGSHDFRLTARWSAEVVQACVVTLEPVPAHHDEEFELIYSPRAASADYQASPRQEVQVGYDDHGQELQDPPEPLVDGRIDVGEVIAEQLALALEPYPRKPDAVLPMQVIDPSLGDAESGSRENPFAVLQRLKGKDGTSGGRN